MTKPDEGALAGIRLKLLRAMATWMRSTVKLTPSSTDTRLTRQARCGQVPLSDWRVLASLGAGHGDRLHTLIPRRRRYGRPCIAAAAPSSESSGA